MFTLYFQILVACWKTFGFGRTFLQWLLITPLFLGFTKLTLWLDSIFFAKYQTVQIKSPIFIIGHPRSGTTFLHHLLTQTEEYTTFKAWQILFPALTARKLLKPLIDYLIKTNRGAVVPDGVGHGVSLGRVEEEEMLFLHRGDTQFVLLTTPLAFADQEYPELRFFDQQPDQRRFSSVKFFAECLKRHIYYTGKEQVVAQIHFSTHRVKTLLEVFPDAKFIYLVRSPYETIPSHLTVERNFLAHHWRSETIPADKLERYLGRRYRYNIDLYRYFYNLQQEQEIPDRNFLILRYDALVSDLNSAFETIVEFTGIQPSQALQQAVTHQAEAQRHYQRQHTVKKLEEFNLTPEQIAQDFDFVFAAYGFDKFPQRSRSAA